MLTKSCVMFFSPFRAVLSNVVVNNWCNSTSQNMRNIGSAVFFNLKGFNSNSLPPAHPFQIATTLNCDSRPISIVSCLNIKLIVQFVFTSLIRDVLRDTSVSLCSAVRQGSFIFDHLNGNTKVFCPQIQN